MAEATSGANLLARKEYAKTIPLLKEDVDRYPSNPRTRLQYADALAGNGNFEEALAQYEETAKYYDDNGLTVQAIAVRKKAEKVNQFIATNTKPKAEDVSGVPEPVFQSTGSVPSSPLFEVLKDEERKALVREMQLEQHAEGDVILSEGDPGTSMYVIARGEVKVYTRNKGGGSL